MEESSWRPARDTGKAAPVLVDVLAGRRRAAGKF
jgi:hypothetical protein